MNSAEDRQPRPQGAFPWLCMRWARELEAPGDEVGRSDKRCRSFSTRERLQRHSVSPAWRLDGETRRRLIYSLKVFYFLLHRRRYFLFVSEFI